MTDQIVIIFDKVLDDTDQEWVCQIQGVEGFLAHYGIEGRNALVQMLSTITGATFHMYDKQVGAYH